jgi:hypothetical protein
MFPISFSTGDSYGYSVRLEMIENDDETLELEMLKE